MKATGMTRPIDQLGRVCIPIEIRESFGLKRDDHVEIFVDGQDIILRKHQAGCFICGETDAVAVGGVLLCRACIAKFEERKGQAW